MAGGGDASSAGGGGGGSKGDLFEVFVHAEWMPDDDDWEEGESGGGGEFQEEIEVEGGRMFEEGLVAACARKPAPLLSWQAGKELGIGLLGGGMLGPAARARALLRPSWSLLLSPNLRSLALSRDGGVSLLSADDEFSSPRGEWEAPPASGPAGAGQWRRMAWSADGNLLAVSDAYGRASLLSHTALRPLGRVQAVGESEPCADLCFLPAPAPVYTLAALSFEGLVYVMPVNMGKHGGLVQAPQDTTPPAPLSLSPWHTNVTCMAACHPMGLVAFGGWDANDAGSRAGSPPSVTLWRALEDASLDLVYAASADGTGRGRKGGEGIIGRMLSAFSYTQRGGSGGGGDMGKAVTKLAFSPSGRYLAVLEASGALHVLDCGSAPPSFRFQSPPAGLHAGEGDDWSKTASDVAWWGDEILVISRRGGVTTGHQVSQGFPRLGGGAKGLLGSFHALPSVTAALSGDEGGMFVLECRRRPGAKGGESPGEADATPQAQTWYGKLMPSLAPAPSGDGGGRFLRRFRLVSVFRSTADRLLQRRLEKREYKAALELASEYGLPLDTVYKYQWEHTEVLSPCASRAPPNPQPHNIEIHIFRHRAADQQKHTVCNS